MTILVQAGPQSFRFVNAEKGTTVRIFNLNEDITSVASNGNQGVVLTKYHGKSKMYTYDLSKCIQLRSLVIG